MRMRRKCENVAMLSFYKSSHQIHMGNATNAEKARRTKAKRRDANKRKSRAGTLANVMKASQRQKCLVCLTTMSPAAKLSVVCGHEFHRRCFTSACCKPTGRAPLLNQNLNQTKQPNVHSLEEAEESVFDLFNGCSPHTSLTQSVPEYLL
uniref:RING-type domain-containing protein n=1 Tax=Globodera pallida TaxID=36090 RepID=A0A183CE31_GLOPA